MQFLSGEDDGRYSIPLESVVAQDEGGKYKSASLLAVNPFSPPILKREDTSVIYPLEGLEVLSLDTFSKPPPQLKRLDCSGLCPKALSDDFSLDFVVPKKFSNCPKLKNLLLEINVPLKPDFLLPHNFLAIDKYPLSLDEIKLRLDSVLCERVDASCQYVDSEYMWNVLFLKASSSHKAQIRIYQDSDELFLVEAQRLSGSSQSFNAMYREIKNVITGSYNVELGVTPVFPVPEVSPLSEGEMSLSLAPIVSMATDQFMECQLEAGKILCDLSQNEGIHGALREAGCIGALVGLVSSDMECIRDHAVLALANLSSSQCCQEAIINAGVLPVLLSLVKNGPYSSAVSGRESARLLANLSDCLANRVVTALGEKAVLEWMQSVDGLSDMFLRQQAIRARYSLASAVTMAKE